MNKKEEILRIFSLRLRKILFKLELDYEKLSEIHLRVNQPLLMVYENKEYYVTEEANLNQKGDQALRISLNELRETMEYISNYSLYAFEEELRQGFITIQGGHRIGITGKVIMEERKIKTIKYISFIHIRLSHQIKGCADRIMPFLKEGKGDRLKHTMIISPPGCGKTTLLRDIIRQISGSITEKEKGCTVGVVDERSEIGACYMGVPQNDLGMRTDILDCCPKQEGMMMLIRSMSPQVIAVDEIGGIDDVEAVAYAMHCGCNMLVTVHGKDLEDIKEREAFRKLTRQEGFERYIILSNRFHTGTIEGVFDRERRKLYSE